MQDVLLSVISTCVYTRRHPVGSKAAATARVLLMWTAVTQHEVNHSSCVDPFHTKAKKNSLADCMTSLRLLELRVPGHVLLGSRPSLLCRWELGPGDILYSIKWYKDGKEFFRHLPRDREPHRRFYLPGVEVESSDALGSNLSLSAVTLLTGGRYRCEVSGEGPLFPTVSDHADMIVVVLPEYGPVVSGFRPLYRIGERVHVNCTSGRSQPAIQLTWYINGEPAPFGTVTSPIVLKDREGFSTSSLKLDFKVTKRHFQNGGLKVKCLATLASVYWRSNEETAREMKAGIQDTLIVKKYNATNTKSNCGHSIQTFYEISSRGVRGRGRLVHNTTQVQYARNHKNADANELSTGLIKSAKRTGQLSLCNRGLGTVPDNVWKIDELVLEETKEVDFSRSDNSNWWNAEPLKTLDLSSNVIKTIPPDVKLLQQLVTLKLHDNALASLPVELGELKNLANLSLDRNKLVELPKEFYKLTELRWLSISYNELKKIEPDFGDLVMLTFLDLSHNKLTELPPGMGYLVRLVELNLSYNELAELPPDIVNLRELRKLNVSNNCLKRLPAMGELRKMQILDVNHNDIEKLPDFYGCTALKEIYIANNFIQEITEEFCDQMQHLNVLNIRDNKVELLPENISLLQRLKRLDLTNNNLNKLPRNLGLLSQLQSISMAGNKLSSVRQDIISGGTDRMMKYLRDRITEEVESDSNILHNEWPDKFTLKKSQALMLPGKELTSVPDEVFATAATVEVHIVDISKNKLKEVPIGIIRIKQTLSQLILSSNIIESVPREISECAHLQFLDLGKNCLSDLPMEFGNLKSMRELVISCNKFTKIPRCVYEMENLEILLAAENQVTEINVSSDALAKLRRLAVLDLTNNSIVTVPPELGHFTNLRSLELMGNCFRQPRHAILAKGTASLLSYLRDRIPT
ncbi:unnamed protein product, partial [Iphiclides podalirius]